MAIEGTLHRGFVTEKADKVIYMARTGSLWPMAFGLGAERRRTTEVAARCG
jgi:NADH:ubiquinone oxidoreductase subunit B-like Fe-S oxidoreductase